MRHTVADVAEKLDVDKEAARGLVKFLLAVNLATEMGERKPENGIGRAEKVFELQDGFEGLLADLLEAGKLNE